MSCHFAEIVSSANPWRLGSITPSHSRECTGTREQHCCTVLHSEKLVYCLTNGKMSRHSWTNHLPGTQQRHMECSLCEGWTIFLLLCKGEELLKGFRNAFLCLLVSSLACNFLRENEKGCYKCCFSLLPNWNRTLDVSLHMKNNRYENFEK